MMTVIRIIAPEFTMFRSEKMTLSERVIVRRSNQKGNSDLC